VKLALGEGNLDLVLLEQIPDLETDIATGKRDLDRIQDPDEELEVDATVAEPIQHHSRWGFLNNIRVLCRLKE
jgi:hypothetical protein